MPNSLTQEPPCGHWDAIVVGTGPGGATLGRELAKSGKRVLFLEKGIQLRSQPGILAGDYAESSFPTRAAPGPQHAAFLERAGRSHESILDLSARKPRTYVPFIGAGTGGSSSLFGMAMERFFPSDFTPRRNFPAAADAALPDAWPISYDEMAPYYAAAEKLYRVKGGKDRMREDPSELPPAPPLTPAGQALSARLESAGLHPYRLPMACDFAPECACCQGFLCPRECKNDSARICLDDAIVNHHATLLHRCRVTRLLATSDRVTGVECEYGQKKVVFSGDLIVLAAGALATPCILLRSASPEWPNGLANASGLVGRHLMRHYIDLYVLRPDSGAGLDNRQKEIAFNDYYQTGEGKWGSVQSFGRLPPPDMLIATVLQDLRDGIAPWAASIFAFAAPLMRPFLRRMVDKSVVLASIVEDLPYPDNAVRPLADGRIGLMYRLREHDRRRIAELRKRLLELLKPYRVRLVKQAENNERIAHACGTCRFGTDPRTSVLDPLNRAHGLSNLYVVDSSFFPTSGGTNPALTIAANALRVAEQLTR